MRINTRNSRASVSKNAAHRTYSVQCARRFHCLVVHHVPCRWVSSCAGCFTGSSARMPLMVLKYTVRLFAAWDFAIREGVLPWSPAEWRLRHCLLLVCRSCVRVSGASDRCVTCNLFRLLNPGFPEAAKRWSQIGRHGWPCVRISTCAVRSLPQVDGKSLSPLSSWSGRAWSGLILPTVGGGGTSCATTVQLANPTGTFSTPMGVVEPPIPLADSGFSRLHSTRPGDRVPASNLHHIF